MSLPDVARRFADGSNPSTKASIDLYPIYQRYLGDAQHRAFTLLEVGVHSGESLKTFATYFANTLVIGVGVMDDGADFSGFSNIRFEQGDQRDSARLAEICRRHAPGGLNVVIDHASHDGADGMEAYRHLFPLLKSGGFYFVENWAPGYLDSWEYGSRLPAFAPPGPTAVPSAKHIPSDDFGMAGFMKRLVHEVMGHTKLSRGPLEPQTPPDRVAEMSVHQDMVVLRKA